MLVNGAVKMDEFGKEVGDIVGSGDVLEEEVVVVVGSVADVAVDDEDVVASETVSVGLLWSDEMGVAAAVVTADVTCGLAELALSSAVVVC